MKLEFLPLINTKNRYSLEERKKKQKKTRRKFNDQKGKNKSFFSKNKRNIQNRNRQKINRGINSNFCSLEIQTTKSIKRLLLLLSGLVKRKETQ